MAEKLELYNLIHQKTKTPRVSLVPDINQIIRYDYFQKNPLSTFRLETVRRREVSAILNACLEHSKSPEIPRKESTELHKPRLLKSLYIQKFEEWISETPVQGLLSSWEENITNLIPKAVRKRQSGQFAILLREVKEEYLEQMKDLRIRMTLAFDTEQESDEDSSCHHLEAGVYSSRRLSVQPASESFSKNRASLADKYLLSHHSIRSVVAKAYFKLPNLFFDLKHYRDSGLLDLNELHELAMKDLRKNSTIVTNQFYGSVAKILRPGSRMGVPPRKLSRLVRCMTNVFAQQILNSMISTINRLISAIEKERCFPQIRLKLVCEENDIIVAPAIDEVCSFYHKIIDKIANIANDLRPFETLLKIEAKNECIKVQLPDWFLDEAHDKLQRVVDGIFQPLSAHLDAVKSQFGVVCASETAEEIATLVSEGRNFDAYCAQVERFNAFRKRINAMVKNVYCFVGRLEQEPAKGTLKERASEFVDVLARKLVEYHREFNLSICSEFESLRATALDVPEEAKALFELSDYVSRASKVLVNELQRKIVESIRMLSSLVQVTNLTDEHMELNRRTVNWLVFVKPVFERSNALCESTKSKLEDELQRGITVLNAEVDDVFPQLVILNDMDDARRIREYVEDLRVMKRQLDRFDEQIRWINLEEKLFKFPETLFPRVVEIKEIIGPFYSLIYLIYQWQRDRAVWLDGPFEYLNASVVESKTSSYHDELTRIGKEYRTKIKMDIAANKPYRFLGIIDDPDPMQQPAPLKLCCQVLKELSEFEEYVPLAICMCNPALLRRHWNQMSAIAGFDLTPNAGSTLRKMIAFDLMENIEKYRAISVGANKELALQEELSRMTKEWDPVNFAIIVDEDEDTTLVEDSEDVQIILEDHLVRIQEMRGSYFVKPIESEVEEFARFLTTVRSSIESWHRLQKQWLHFLPIFSARRATTTPAELSREKVLFSKVEAVLRDAAKDVASDPSVRRIGRSPEFCEKLQRAGEQMEAIRRGVCDYLESKRILFPRYYFLADDEVLRTTFAIGGVAKLCRENLKKCFPFVENLSLDEGGNAHSVIGDCREELHLSSGVRTSPEIVTTEEWLVRLEEEMTAAVRREIVDCCRLFADKHLEEWISQTLGMVVICASRINWTAAIHSCLSTRDKKVLPFHLAERIDLSNELTKALNNRSSRRKRNVLSALIVVAAHQREISEMLIDRDVSDELDFNWCTQMRYHLLDEDVSVAMNDATTKYGYQYSGNEQQLVVTPLTDRCYNTLMQARRYHLYGAVAGPSSSGKSETIKGLARAIAVLFHAFSGCSNRSFTGKILKGLVSCGAWGCLDDFDRMAPQVLSVVTEQIDRISRALSSHSGTCTLEGTELEFKDTAYICVTINTARSARSELPENLKVLFRTIALTVPDLGRISELELLAGGFREAGILSRKLATLRKLCLEQLSSTDRCDFGSRVVKVVTKVAVALKLNYPTEDEAVLLLRSVIDVYMPKLIERDLTTFRGIIRDVFPGVALPPPNYNALLKALEEVCARNHVQVHEAFQLKILQIFETMFTKHAFMLVGQPLSGKTTSLRMLAKALSMLRSGEDNRDVDCDVITETINPRAIGIEQLFGHVDPETKEWREGVYSASFRRFANDETTTRKWLIFDGPVDAAWTENLNTALDDDKTLRLPSGEKISMTSSMSVIFETMDLRESSPTTVSRCGMVHIESPGWRPLVWSTISTRDLYKGYEESVYSLYEWSIDPCLDFVRRNCSETVKMSDIHLVASTLNLFEIYLSDAFEDNPEEKTRRESFATWAQIALILSTIWGLAGTLTLNTRPAFDTFYTALWNGSDGQLPPPAFVKQSDVTLPTEGMLRENAYLFKGKGSWKPWNDLLKNEKILEPLCLGQMVVPTSDTLKYSSLFLRHVKHRRPFLLCGEVATGKSSCVRDVLRNRLSRDEYSSNCFRFTPKTTAREAQRLFLSKLDKMKKNHYDSSRGKFCVNFVDDLSLPMEGEPAESPLELVRQYFDHGYWYHSTRPEKVIVRGVTFLCATTTIRGETEDRICPRFLRHFNVYALWTPSKDGVFRIFSTLLFSSLKRNSFNADVLSSANSITNATIDLYESAVIKLRPIPARFYYRFNLYDVHRIATGCGLVRRESVETKITLIRLWVHETLRVIGDRIANDEDGEWLFERIRDCVKTHFKDAFEAAFDHLPKAEGGQLGRASFKDLIFGNFMDPSKNGNSRRYEEISGFETLKTKVLSYLEEYNEARPSKIDVVLFRSALEHVVRICRILATPGGNMLMICVSAYGKRSLVQLAAWMERQSLSEPDAKSLSDSTAWRDHLKKILKSSGAAGKDLAFYLPAGRIEGAFLEDVDCLLSTGEVAGLFSSNEQREIVGMVRLSAQGGDHNSEMGIPEVMDHFVNRCREKLHILICLNAIGSELRGRLRAHSNLTKRCAFVWFETWPEDALRQVAARYVKCANVKESVRKNAVLACERIHGRAKTISEECYEETGRRSYVTPAAFLHMVRLYVELVSAKQTEIAETRKRYLGGLEKLQLAAQRVAQMKTTLTTLRPQLESSARQTVATMKEIESENVSVANATILVKRDEAVANKKAEIAGKLKAECEADLAVAIPILEDAIAALNTLKPTDITLVKAMKNPPDTVKLVMAAVCVMLSVPPDRTIDPATGRKLTDYWGPSKRVLGDMNFLQNLRDYDKDNIPGALMQVVKKTYMTDKSFMPHVVAKASSAAEGLCKWVRAMVSYDEIAKVVAPKKQKLALAQRECDETEAFLDEKRQILVALNAKLAALNDSLRATLAKKLELENEVESCTGKLRKAESLIESLGGERDRWMLSARNLGVSYDNLAGDMLLACGSIAYLAPFSMARRVAASNEWRTYLRDAKISCSEDYSLRNVLGSEIEINSWYVSGLSKDDFSTENAVIASNSKFWSLFVDPDDQAGSWIRKLEERNDLRVVKFTDADCMETIRRCVQRGSPVLLANVGERLEAALDPILAKNIYERDDITYLVVGESAIPYNPGFRLYVTTKLRRPRYPSDIYSRITVIDFALREEALQERLLDIVVARERAELQEKFEELLVQSVVDEKALKREEDNILVTLSASSTNILEDERAIEILDSSKNLSVGIIERQKASEATRDEINAIRVSYGQLTRYCASLYDTLAVLSHVCCLYRFSLRWFTRSYLTSIDTSNRSSVPERRLNYIRTAFTRNLYFSVSRSLFQEHKLLYSFVLYTKTLLVSGRATPQEIRFLSTHSATCSSATSNPVSAWLSDESWRGICAVNELSPAFQGLASSFSSSAAAWRSYRESTSPEHHPLPSPWNERLAPLQQLLIVRILRPDRFAAKTRLLIERELGSTFVAPTQCDVSRSYSESNCLVPLILVLPSDADLTAILARFAAKLGHLARMLTVSVGQDQGDVARQLVERAKREGRWIFLQNTHLAPAWMPELEAICEELDTTNTALDFRLWLSTRAIEEFPISVSENSVKISSDSPLGLRESLRRCYGSEHLTSREFFEGCPGKDKVFTKLLYGLCFFHAVVMERRRFGSRGWNVPCDFDETDFRMSARQLQAFVNGCRAVPFEALRYFIGSCNYGGRISDEEDRRCLETLLLDYCNARVIDNSNYSFAGAPEYSVPKRCEYRDYVRHVENIPTEVPPEVFGLDGNAAILRNEETFEKFAGYLSTMCEAISSRDAGQSLASMMKDLREKLPRPFAIDEVERSHPTEYSEPLNFVLIREMLMCDRLLRRMRASLDQLDDALEGDATLTAALEELAAQMTVGRVPRLWWVAYPCTFPLALPDFVDLFLKRLLFVKNWIEDGHPRVLQLSHLSRCTAFLSAIRLRYSRARKVPFDDVGFDFEVTTMSEPSEVTGSASEAAIYVHGLLLSGAEWDARGSTLTDSSSKVLWSRMPVVRFGIVAFSPIASAHDYECPLYEAPARSEKFYFGEKSSGRVLSVPLNTNAIAGYWTRRRVALFCQIDRRDDGQTSN